MRESGTFGRFKDSLIFGAVVEGTIMDSMNKTFDMCLKEMFRRAGRKMDENFIRRDKWYEEGSWSRGAEEDFREWMVEKLMRRHEWTRKTAEKEVGFFLLNYSWRHVPEGCMAVRK